MKSWYKVICKKCHNGAGTNDEQTIFYWAKDTIETLDKYKKTGGVQHNQIPFLIEKLDDRKSGVLESFINNNLSISLENAKRKRVRFKRENPPV